MQKVDLPFFVDLGATLESAAHVDSEGPLIDVYFKLFPIRQKIEFLLLGTKIKLTTAAHDLTSLRDSIIEFDKKYFRDEEGNWRWPSDDERNPYLVQSLIDRIAQVKTVLIAEIRTSTSFSVKGVGIFDVEMLVNCASQALDPATIARIPKEARDEIDAAGKCLAFNLPTASGFHAMRAVERILKVYAAEFIDAAQIKKLRNWGAFIEKFEKIVESDAAKKPSEEAVALLRQLKDIYRNPVIHPERVLNSSEASTLFHGTVAALNRVASELAPERISGLGLAFGGTANAVGNALFAAAQKMQPASA